MKQSASTRELPALLGLLLLATAAPGAIAAPELPRSYVNTDYVVPTGRTIAVPSGGNFQSALEAAAPGDVITLAAGATYTGNFILPFKGGSGWILVRTSAPDASLPAAGTRVTAAHAAAMPKIVSNNVSPALSTAPGAHHYRFMGVEFTVAPSVTSSYGLVSLDGGSQTSLSDVPHHLIFDRVYVHGSAIANVRRGFAFNSAWTALIDSRVSEIHELGADSQAVGGWNGPGPFKIVNNYLEAAAENVLFGGADPSIPNLVPSDIEVRGNHMYKPTRWRIGASDYAGKPWVVKNLFELKNARRVLVEGNVFENNWAHGQNGFAILFTVRNQDGSAPWSTVEDVTFVKNTVRHTGSAVNFLGRDNNYPSGRARRITIQDNVFEDVNGTWGGSGRLFQLLSGPAEVVIDHNTGIHSGDILVASDEAAAGFVYRNNATPHNVYGIGGDGTYGNAMLTLSTFFPGAVFTKNILAGGNAASYPAGNYFPSSLAQVGFVNLSAGDYRLGSSSAYRNAGTDGKDLGADCVAVNAAAAAAVQGTSTATPPSPPPPPPPPAPDVTPPVISGLSVGSITSTGATVTWKTNEPADSMVEYGWTTAYGNKKSVTTRVTSRSITLTGLAPSTTYHARAVSKDAAGNTAKSADFAIVTTGASGTGGAPQSVSWTTLVNVTASGGTLTKTGGCNGCQDAGAVSTQQIASGDGYVELTLPATGTQRAIGLSRGNSNTRLDDIDYAWRFWPDGGASVLENGLYRNVATTYQPGDVFRIAVASRAVRYYKNGTLVYTSLLAPLYPLLVDTSFLNLGASFEKVVISTSAGGANVTQVTWKGLVNASASGDSLTKTGGCNGCEDAGAISVQRIRSRGGAVELTVSETGTERVIGLSRGNSNTRIADIDFGLRFWPDGTVDVREKGRSRSVSSAYQPGDVFRIAVASRKVRYYKNDSLLYASRVAPSFPLLVDTSLLDSAAQFSKVVLLR